METGGTEAWQADKSIEAENTGDILIYGDNFPATTLYDILNNGAEITLIQKIFSILITIASETPGFSAPGPEGILISPNRKKILIFDKDFILRCIRQHGETDFVEKFCKWCHPGLEGKWSFIYFLAVIEYYILTETFPFQGKTQEEIHENIIYGDYVPVGKFFPGLDSEIFATLDSILQRKKSKNKPEVNYELLLKSDLTIFRLNKTEEEKESVCEFKIKNRRKISLKKFFVNSLADYAKMLITHHDNGFSNFMISMPYNYPVIEKEYFALSSLGYWGKNWFTDFIDASEEDRLTLASDFFLWDIEEMNAKFWFDFP